MLPRYVPSASTRASSARALPRQEFVARRPNLPPGGTPMRRLLPLLFTAALCVPAAAAEKTPDALSERHAAARAGDHSRLDGEVISEAPHGRARKLAGMGEVKFPITTRVAEAQAFFDQGVAQLHTYYYYEAERSFREAARLDPGCAMAYWGMAM